MRAHPAGTFKTMAEDSMIIKTISNTDDGSNKLLYNSEDSETRRRLSYSSENDINKQEEPNMASKILTLQNAPDDSKSCRLSTEMAEEQSQLPQDVNSCLETKSVKDPCDVKQQCVDSSEDKENTVVVSANSSSGKSIPLKDVVSFANTWFIIFLVHALK